MNFSVDEQIEQRWSPMAPVDAGSAHQAVARRAVAAGVYRARPAETPTAAHQVFRVPPWGPPISVSVGGT
jgi:hypothetical protein